MTSPDIDTNSSTKNLLDNVNNLLDQMAPVKRLTRKEKGLLDRPWVTSGILASMRTRDLLHSEYLKEKNPIIRLNRLKIYKNKRNMVTDLIRISKKGFYSNFFIENKSNLKKTWEGIRGLINVNKKGNSNIDKLIVQNKEVTDPTKMASSALIVFLLI